MTNEDQNVRKDLENLALLQDLKGDPDIELATSDYVKFSEVWTTGPCPILVCCKVRNRLQVNNSR